MPDRFTKDPDAVLDYTINWADWLDVDTISASSWASSTGITIDTDTNTTTTATVWLSGGRISESHTVTNSIITAAGRYEDRSITVSIREK